MTPEQDAFDRWAKWADEIDEGLAKYPPMGGIVLARRFPVPDTAGLTPAEAEAVLAKWRADVDAFERARQAAAAPVGTAPPADAPQPQAPVA